MISNHHNLLLALPRARRITEPHSDRRRLSELLATINEEQA